MHQTTSHSEVIIIGAGMSGICMGIKLLKANITDFMILEKASDVSGTWFYNNYPGSGCDIPSALYNYSFYLNPNWSKKYSLQEEIKDYFKECVVNFNLSNHIRLSSELLSAKFDEKLNLWNLTLANQQQMTCRFLISGLGQLNAPYQPEFKGSERFRGVTFHSSQWNHKVDVTNKNVCVIGNAASALQFIPHLVSRAKKVNVLQRSPNYVIPRNDRLYSEFEKKCFKLFPLFQRIHRFWIYLRQEMFYGVIVNNKWSQKTLTNEFKRYISDHIKDNNLLEKLTPTYPIGCKRILVSDNYYQSISQPNVSLEVEPISEFSDLGIVTQSGKQIVADIVIYATGFKTNEFLYPVKFYGKNNIPLNEVWINGAESYRGVCVKHFPNFFILYGPNTNLGSNSIIFMVEQQVKYVIKCIKKLKQKKFSRIEIREHIFDSYNKNIQLDMQKTVWIESCNSWYKNKDGKVVNNWPNSPTSYYFHMKFPNYSHFLMCN